MLPIEPEISVKVFISYAHADQELHRKLEEHLSALKYSGKITVWQDQEIPPGANWQDQIDTHLNEADIILLLVSASFIASKYCWNKEVRAALERHKGGTVRVIPILLKPALWEDTPLGQLQALPTGAKPVVEWNDQDVAFDNVVRGIRKVVEDLLRVLQEEAKETEKKRKLQDQRFPPSPWAPISMPAEASQQQIHSSNAQKASRKLKPEEIGALFVFIIMALVPAWIFGQFGFNLVTILIGIVLFSIAFLGMLGTYVRFTRRKR